MFNKNAAQAYAKIGMETSIDAASPHKLILMLFDGALAAIGVARLNMQQKNIPAKGAAITRAIAIINEGLRVSLNLEAGGDIAQNLQRLYDYMCQRLLEANLSNQVEVLDEVAGLLGEIKSAWEAIGQPQPAVASQAAPAAAMEPRAAVSYGKA